MKLKRIASLALSAALLLGLFILPPQNRAEAAGVGVFTDVSDPQVAEAVELLRLLGAVNGAGGGKYYPDGTLTRAEFCKLAVVVMGKADLEPAQRNRTIFLDVPSTHWARGYVNLASTLTPGGEPAGAESASGRLIAGVGNGTFQPDTPIKFAEAVTLLMRILGFSDTDMSVGSTWYDGYLSMAAARGLTQGIKAGALDAVTRGQAALLFRNLLFTEVKDSDTRYLQAKLGGSLTPDSIVLGYSETSPSGKPGVSVAGKEALVLTDRLGVAPELLGVRGELAADKNGRFLTILPNDSDTIRRVTLTAAPTKDGKLVAGNEQITIPNNATVYRGGKTETYSEVMSKLYSGTHLVLCYGADGALAYLCVTGGTGSSTAGSKAMVARQDPNGSNPFTALTGGDTGYQIYKNGVPAAVADLRQYDVAVYDRSSKILQVSDLRLTGLFEKAAPNPNLPTSVTVMGQEFPVLTEGAADLASFKLGSTITLLLTVNGEVAGVVAPSAARSSIVGVASISGDEATVTPLVDIPGTDGPRKFTGKHGLSTASANAMNGQIVTISSYKKDQISLSKVSGSGASGVLDLETQTVGSVKLSDNVRFFEKVGTSALTEIRPGAITLARVPAGKIAYVHKDYAGKIDVVVLEDVTGDLYEYGFLTKDTVETDTWYNASTEKNEAITNSAVIIRNSDHPTGSDKIITGAAFNENNPGGVALSAARFKDSYPQAAAVISLTELKDVGANLFDLDAGYLTVDGERYPIAGNVQCYHKATGTWFNADAETGLEALEDLLNYGGTFDAYYDKAPGQGGKIRMVILR